MFQKFKGKLVAVAPSAGLLFAVGNSHATGIDVSTVTTAISDALVPIGSIGLAVLGLLVAVKTYKWIRRAM